MVEQFEDELRLIKDQRIREFVVAVLENVHGDFWTMPASTSGKYHPKLAQGDGGLINHTKVAVYFGRRIARCYGLTPQQDDLVIAALIIHDICKPEERELYKTTTHSDLAIVAMDKLADDKGVLSEEWYERLKLLVFHHMGPWSPDKPDFYMDFNALEQVVHLGDYVAAQKFLCIDDISVINKEA